MIYLRHFRWVIKNMWGHFKCDGGREWTQPLYLSAPSSRTHSRGSCRTEIRYSRGSLCTSLLGLFSPQLLEERSPWHFSRRTPPPPLYFSLWNAWAVLYDLELKWRILNQPLGAIWDEEILQQVFTTACAEYKVTAKDGTLKQWLTHIHKHGHIEVLSGFCRSGRNVSVY